MKYLEHKEAVWGGLTVRLCWLTDEASMMGKRNLSFTYNYSLYNSQDETTYIKLMQSRKMLLSKR